MTLCLILISNSSLIQLFLQTDGTFVKNVGDLGELPVNIELTG